MVHVLPTENNPLLSFQHWLFLSGRFLTERLSSILFHVFFTAVFKSISILRATSWSIKNHHNPKFNAKFHRISWFRLKAFRFLIIAYLTSKSWSSSVCKRVLTKSARSCTVSKTPAVRKYSQIIYAICFPRKNRSEFLSSSLVIYSFYNLSWRVWGAQIVWTATTYLNICFWEFVFHFVNHDFRIWCGKRRSVLLVSDFGRYCQMMFVLTLFVPMLHFASFFPSTFSHVGDP